MYSFAQVVRAPRIAFSAKKIWIAFLGLLVGVIVYSVLTYVAYSILPEWTVKEVWRTYRYIPVPVPGVTHFPWYSWTIWGIGVALFVFIQMLSISAISKVTYEELRGNEFYEVMDALRYALKKAKANILAPITLAIFIGVFILIGCLLGLFGKIPYVGPIVIGLLFIFIALAALFVIYLIIVFFVSFLLSPSIAAGVEKDVFDVLFENFSTLNEQTWRLVLWEIFIAFCVFAGVWIFGWLTKKGLLLANWVLSVWGHSWWKSVWNNGLWYLSPVPPITWVEALTARIAPTLIHGPEWVPVNWAQLVSSFCVGLALYFIMFMVLGYGIATWAAGQSLIYAVLVKYKDDRDLLKEIEEEEKEREKEEEEKKEEIPEKVEATEAKEEKPSEEKEKPEESTKEEGETQ